MNNSIVDRQRAIVEAHIRGENEHDWNAVYDTFVQDNRAHYDVIPLAKSFPGIEGVRGFYQIIATAFPDLRIDVKSEYDVPGCSIREVVITGTHNADFLGIKPRGYRVRIEMAAFYTFDEAVHKLVSERIYYDQASAVAQMLGQRSAVAV